MKQSKNIFSRSPFLANVTKLLSVNVLVQIFAFALSTIITRLYSEDDFGLLAKFMSIASIFVLFGTLRLEFAIILPKKEQEANALMSLGFLFSLLSALLSFVVLYFCSHYLNTYFNINSVQYWIFIMPFTIFFIASFNLLINYKNRQKKYNEIAAGQVVQGISNPLTSYGFYGIINYGLIQALLFANFLGSLYLGFTLLNKKVFNSSSNLKQVLQKYYRFPTFNLSHALINNVSSSLPVFMLSPVFENYFIGLFTMAIGKIFKPIHLFNNVIYQVFSKKIVDDVHLNKDVSKQFKKVVFTLVIIGIVPFTLMYFFAPEIFSFVFGKKWFQAGVYIKLMLPWLFMVYLCGSFSFVPNLFRQQKNAMLIEIVYLLLRFGALTYGISKSSLEIALSAYAWTGVFMLIFTLLWYYYLVKYKKIEDE